MGRVGSSLVSENPSHHGGIANKTSKELNFKQEIQIANVCATNIARTARQKLQG
jgi:hypothetical protein